MSTEPPCRSLAGYVTCLLAALDTDDPAAGERLRRVVEGRSAILQLDQERVRVSARTGRVVVTENTAGPGGDGIGMTDRTTVLDVLDGTQEISEAVLTGRLRARGAARDVAAMFAAIEIILDASARSPQLQQLAGDFRRDPCRPTHVPKAGGGGGASWLALRDDEAQLLAELDLLPEPSPGT